MLLCSLLLLVHFTFARGKLLILELKLVNLAFDLNLQLIYCLYDCWVGFLEKLYIVTAVLAVDHALRTDGRHIAIEAEVLNLFFGMLAA